MALVQTTVDEITAEADFIFSSDEHPDFVMCKNPDKLKMLLEAIKPGKHVHFKTDGDWSAHDLVVELVKRFRPCSLHIATYAVREYAMRQIILAMDVGDITELHMLVDNRVKSQAPGVFHLAKANADSFSYDMVHGKATVLKGPNGCVSIMGSQNYTGNPRLEFGVATLEPGVADFYINCINEGIGNGKELE